MNIIDIIKLRLKIPIKKLEAPIQELTREQKMMLLMQMQNEIKNTNRIPEKFWRVIDSLNEKDKKLAIYHFKEFAFFNTDKKVQKELCKNFDLRYCNIYELKKKLFSNITEYDLYIEEIFEKVLPYLNESEIKVFMKTPVFWRISQEQKNKIYDLVVTKIELPSRSILSRSQDDVLRILNQVSFGEKAKICNEIYKYGSIELKTMLEKYIVTLDKMEQFYLKMQNSIGILDFEETLSVQELGEFFSKYRKYLTNNINYNINKYLNEKSYSLEDIKNIKELVVEKNGQDDVAQITQILDEIYLRKQAVKCFSEYNNLKTAEEKDEYFRKLPKEILIYMNGSFLESIERLSKEEIIDKIGNDINSNYYYLIAKKLSADEMFDLIKSNNNKLKDSTALCILDYYILRFDNNQIKYIFKNCIVSEQKKELFVYIYNKIRFSRKIDEKQKNKIIDIVKELLLDKDVCEELGIVDLKDVINIDELKELIKNNPNIIKHINFSTYNFSELIQLKDIASNEEKYNIAVLKSYDIEFMQKNKELVKSMQKESYIKVIELCNSEFLSLLHEKIYDLDIDVNEIFESLHSKEAKIFLISNINYKIFDENEELVKKWLSEIDDTGEILKFYETINLDTIEQIQKGQYIENIEREEKFKKIDFLNNLNIIFQNKDKIKELLKENPTILVTMNFKFLNIFENLKSLEFFSKYLSQKGIYFSDSEIIYNLCKKIVKEVEANLKYPEEVISKCLSCTKELSEDVAREFLENEEDLDMIIYLMQNRSYLFHYFSKEENLGKLKRDEAKFCDNIMLNSNLTVDQAKDAYMRRFFAMTYDEAKNHIKKYSSGIRKLISIYDKKENLTIKEQQELSSLKTLQYIKEILNIDDLELLKEMYEKFKEDPQYTNINYFESFMLEENIKCAYNKEKITNLYIPKSEDIVKNITFNGKEISVYRPKENWNMIITVIGAFVENKEAKKQAKANWNSKEKNINHGICTSLIGNDNLSMAKNKNNLIYGFYRLTQFSIQNEAPYDLSSNSNDIEINSLLEGEFRTTQDLKNNVRQGHSEIILERRNENGNIRRQPDYIIAINKITNEAKKAAQEFGVPIILLDTRKIAKAENEAMQRIKEELKENLDIKKIEELFVKYHNNYAGMLTVDKKTCKKVFDSRIAQKYFSEIVDKIATIKDKDQRLLMAKKYKQILMKEEQKRKELSDKYIPFKLDGIINKIDLLIASFPQNIEDMDYLKVDRKKVLEEIQSDFKKGVYRNESTTR